MAMQDNYVDRYVRPAPAQGLDMTGFSNPTSNMFGQSLASMQATASEASAKRRQQAGMLAAQNSNSPAMASGLAQAAYALGSGMFGNTGVSAEEQAKAEAGQAKTAQISAVFADKNATVEQKLQLADYLAQSDSEQARAVGNYHGGILRAEIKEDTRISEKKADEETRQKELVQSQKKRLYGFKVVGDKQVFDGTSVTGNVDTVHPDSAEGSYYSANAPKNMAKGDTIKVGYGQPKIYAESVKALTADFNEMKGSVRTLQNFKKADDRLRDDKIDLMVGAGGGVKTQILKVFEAVGLGSSANSKSIADTEEFLALMGQGAAELIASGAFGAGTGISDRDLKTAQALLAADQGLDRKGMQLIVKLRAALETAKIQQYEEGLKGYKPDFWGAAPKTRDSYSLSKAVPKHWRPQDENDTTLGGGWAPVDFQLPVITGGVVVDGFQPTMDKDGNPIAVTGKEVSDEEYFNALVTN